MELPDAIKSRKSVRKFSSKKPDWRDIIESINSSQYAPMAGDIFSMKFVIVDDKKIIEEIAKWAEQEFIAEAKYVVEWAFKRFFSNISANVIGIENIIKNRILTDELVYPLSVYGGKVENIKNKISGNEKPILAVGDSIGDEKMLEYSQVKIVVDRNNQLTKIAKDKGWIVLLQR